MVSPDNKEEAKAESRKKRGQMILDLSRNVVVDHFPSKSARTRGPIVWDLPAELAWEWFMPRELDTRN